MRRDRLWLVLLLGAVVVALFPWTAYLSTTLPERHLARHWDLAWVGFDLFLAVVLGLTVLALAAGSRLLPFLAAVAGTALLCDAWFDVITSHTGRDQTWALLEAFAVELPLAALCFWISVSATSAGAVSAAGPRPTAQRARRAGGLPGARTSRSEAPSPGRTSR
jgi:hypothetical protein